MYIYNYTYIYNYMASEDSTPVAHLSAIVRYISSSIFTSLASQDWQDFRVLLE